MNRRLHRSGFTLVELLIVIGIIVMLAAIVVPVLNQGREKAHAVRCMSSLKSLGTGLSQYVHTNGDFLPPCNTGKAGGQWYYTMLPYVENWELYQCFSKLPANDVPEVAADTSGNHWSVHYGMNFQLTGVDAEMSASIQLTSVVNPANALYIADAALFGAFRPGKDGIMIPDVDTESPGSVIDGAVYFPQAGTELPSDRVVVAPRHNGTANCLFLDTSVRRLSVEDLLRVGRGRPNCLYEAKLDTDL